MILPRPSSSPVGQFVGEIPSSLNNPYAQISIHLIKQVPLPSSWYWQDKCLKKDNQYICSKFEWMNNENNNFEYIKSIIVDGNSIRYFVRGKHVVGQQLKTRFSTVSELATVVKTFDETPLCGGPILSETITLSHANATHKIPSKSCLQLTTGNQRYCRECSTLIESLKGKTTNNSSHYNAPKPGPANSTQSDAHSTGNRAGNISNAPPKIINVILKSPSTASRPLSDITNQNEEPEDSTSTADHSYHITSNLDKSSNEKANEPTITGDRLSKDQTAVDLNVLPDREAVTLQNICTVITSNTCSKDLEQRLIKRPTLLKTSNYPLHLYNLHTWRYGVYSPLNPFTVSSEVDDRCISVTNMPPFVIDQSQETSCTAKQSNDVQSEEQVSQETLPIFHIPKMTYGKKKFRPVAKKVQSTSIPSTAANNAGSQSQTKPIRNYLLKKQVCQSKVPAPVNSKQPIEQEEASRPTTSMAPGPHRVYKRKEQMGQSNAVVPSNLKTLRNLKPRPDNTEISVNQPPQIRPMLPIISQPFFPNPVQILPPNFLFQPILLQLLPQQHCLPSSTINQPSQVEKDNNDSQPVEDPPSEEEKNDLESALNFLKKQTRKKKLLHRKIRILSKQLNT